MLYYGIFIGWISMAIIGLIIWKVKKIKLKAFQQRCSKGRFGGVVV